MNTLLRAALLAAALLGGTGVRAAGFADSPAALCEQALAGTERAARIAPQLLRTIGLVETGRRDPRSGRVGPWPWTIDVNGQGFFFDTKQQAMDAVAAFQSRGIQSIDVGCMQVNLLAHPQAFATLSDALDPATNVAYAARFLNRLYGQFGEWPKAAAAYHSQTPELGEVYLRRVMAVWPMGRNYAPVFAAPEPVPTNYTPELNAQLRAQRSDLDRLVAEMSLPRPVDMRRRLLEGVAPVRQVAATREARANRLAPSDALPLANRGALAAFGPVSSEPPAPRPGARLLPGQRRS